MIKRVYIRGLISGLYFNGLWDKFVEFEKATHSTPPKVRRLMSRATKFEPSEAVEVWMED